MQNDFIFNDAIIEQIRIVAKLKNLSAYVIEKDFYVTRAISFVNQISDPNYDLIFQGGTALSKAHRIIERMSEDCDFRVCIKNTEKTLSKEAKRRALRKFRHALVDQLRLNGFEIDQQDIRTRDEGRFMEIRAQYPSSFNHQASLKPFMALEFVVNDVKMPIVSKPVTTLIQQVLGDKVNHPEFSVKALTVVEIAAEKWVGLTRRIATIAHKDYYEDVNLVRHLYDLYQIEQCGQFTDEFYRLVPNIIESDRTHYKNHNTDYYQNPVAEIKRAITELATSKTWSDHWTRFVESMVFADQVPSYDAVIQNLHNKSEKILEALETV